MHSVKPFSKAITGALKPIYNQIKKYEPGLNSNYNNIYRHKSILNEESENPCQASFLNLLIEVHDRKFASEFFGELDIFPFYINPMPYLDSNSK